MKKDYLENGTNISLPTEKQIHLRNSKKKVTCNNNESYLLAN